jgi:hypothetical protein
MSLCILCTLIFVGAAAFPVGLWLIITQSKNEILESIGFLFTIFGLFTWGACIIGRFSWGTDPVEPEKPNQDEDPIQVEML